MRVPGVGDGCAKHRPKARLRDGVVSGAGLVCRRIRLNARACTIRGGIQTQRLNLHSASRPQFATRKLSHIKQPDAPTKFPPPRPKVEWARGAARTTADARHGAVLSHGRGNGAPRCLDVRRIRCPVQPTVGDAGGHGIQGLPAHAKKRRDDGAALQRCGCVCVWGGGCVVVMVVLVVLVVVVVGA